MEQEQEYNGGMVVFGPVLIVVLVLALLAMVL